jgi:hypothetical protein
MTINLPVLVFETSQLTAGERAKFDKGIWYCNDLPLSPDSKYLVLCTTRKNVRFHEEGSPEVIAEAPDKPLLDPDELNAKIPRSRR